MCELMGMSFNRKVKAKFSFKGLLNHSPKNKDGWGLAYYPEGRQAAQVFKEPVKGAASQLAEFIQSYNRIWFHRGWCY